MLYYIPWSLMEMGEGEGGDLSDGNIESGSDL